MRQGVLRHFGCIEKDAAKGISLRHDHGSTYMSGDFQDDIATFVVVETTPFLIRQPERNGVAERFIRTLKETFSGCTPFDTIEDLRRGPKDFAAHYDATWLVARNGYQTRISFGRSSTALPSPPSPLYPWLPE